MHESIPRRVIKDHSFLAEELLIPTMNHMDGGRINLFANHINQTLTISNPETPLLFSNFENEVGKYCSDISRFDLTDDKWEILSIIKLNIYRTFVVIKNVDTNFVDIVDYKRAVNLTESFGYTNNFNHALNEGDILSKNDNTWIYKSGILDDELNMQYGANLNAVYLSYKGLTYEDGIVVSESAAKKMSHTDVNTYEFIVNRNDILLNLYGDELIYKALPSIGEEVKDNVLCGIRRINNSKVVSDYKTHNLKKLKNDDTLYMASGVVTDIEVFGNYIHNDKSIFTSQLRDVIEEAKEGYSQLVDLVEILKEEEFELSDDLIYYTSKAKDYLNDEKPYQGDRGKKFHGYFVRITVARETPLIKGSKITNRYGGKGVVSRVIPDKEMPVNEYGEIVDVILNPLGVIGRKNISQLIEQELNFLSHNIIREFGNDNKLLLEKIIDFYSILSEVQPVEGREINLVKDYVDYFINFTNNLSEGKLNEFLEEFKEIGNFPIYQPPFWDTVDLDILGKLYDKFPYQLYKFDGIEDRLMMGKIYYFALKHLADGKYSVRSSEGSNLVGTPYRSNAKYKDGKVLFNSNPVKMGEQEYFLLSMLNNPEVHNKFIKSYSSSYEARQYMNELLISKPINKITRVINEEINNKASNAAQVVMGELRSLGIDIQFDKKEIEGSKEMTDEELIAQFDEERISKLEILEIIKSSLKAIIDNDDQDDTLEYEDYLDIALEVANDLCSDEDNDCKVEDIEEDIKAFVASLIKE